jgi:leader peptidase (prepilin peptidase)/N-methyltransferase
MAAGAVVGLVFMVISKVTEEKIGYGDSLLILALGIFLGFWKVMIVTLIAFFGSALCAIIMVSCMKKSRKTSFPFVPFIAISYALVVFVL